ncbi:MAG: 2Fe-2S iron-sulfur cluster-binding protein [Candidatus Hydrogenedentota bacterium]
MAKVVLDGRSIEVPDGAAIMDACELLGVPFGCRGGICATCAVQVVAGAENLEPPNEMERWMDLFPGERLACQARIRAGTVVLRR